MNTSISAISLQNFRNFTNKIFNFTHQNAIIYGNNGIGKTNLLEAISMFSKNNTLRQASNGDILQQGGTHWQLQLKFDQHNCFQDLGLHFCLQKQQKTFYINGEAKSNIRQKDFRNYLPNFIYLTPQLEQLFILGKSERREYLDRIVLDLDHDHQTRLNQYQKLNKERLAILQHHNSDAWLNIVEHKISEIAVAIAAARLETVDFFNKSIANFASNFPLIKLEIIGDSENILTNNSSLFCENFYRLQLKNNRDLDKLSSKTSFGIHRTDFSAIFLPKKSPAHLCSTGEQKLIMIAISLARAKISAFYKKQLTILMLDEIFSHLDNNAKANLLEEIYLTKLTAFFTATSLSLLPKHRLDLQEIAIS